MRAQLVRSHNDISPSPIRPLAGAQGVRLGASLPARHSCARSHPSAPERPRAIGSTCFIEGVTTGPISFGPRETPMPERCAGARPRVTRASVPEYLSQRIVSRFAVEAGTVGTVRDYL